MPQSTGDESNKTPMMWFFVALGLLLFLSTMFPSCHSKEKHYMPETIGVENHRPPHYSPTPPPSGSQTSRTSPTPPAKPLVSPTSPTSPPHH